MADDYIFPKDEYILIGKIGKAHGLRGEVKIHALASNENNLLDYKTVVLVDTQGKLSPPLIIEKGRLQGKNRIVKIVNHTKGLSSFAQKSVEMTMAAIMRMPPMVGTPCLTR